VRVEGTKSKMSTFRMRLLPVKDLPRPEREAKAYTIRLADPFSSPSEEGDLPMVPRFSPATFSCKRIAFVALSAVTVAFETSSHAVVDSDGDGLTDDVEISIGTDPFNPDTDADLLTDGIEVLVGGTNPLDPDSDDDGLLDGVEDANRDGVVQWFFETNPRDPDSDDDSLLDGQEVLTSPVLPDSDDDGLCDGTRIAGAPGAPFPSDPCAYSEGTYGTKPWLFDTDGDGYGDGEEVFAGSDPLDPNSTPKTIAVTPTSWGRVKALYER
jgi:hypothetical protein